MSADFKHKTLITTVVVLPFAAVLLAMYWAWNQYLFAEDLILMVVFFVPDGDWYWSGVSSVADTREFQDVRTRQSLLSHLCCDGVRGGSTGVGGYTHQASCPQ